MTNSKKLPREAAHLILTHDQTLDRELSNIKYNLDLPEIGISDDEVEALVDDPARALKMVESLREKYCRLIEAFHENAEKVDDERVRDKLVTAERATIYLERELNLVQMRLKQINSTIH